MSDFGLDLAILYVFLFVMCTVMSQKKEDLFCNLSLIGIEPFMNPASNLSDHIFLNPVVCCWSNISGHYRMHEH